MTDCGITHYLLFGATIVLLLFSVSHVSGAQQEASTHDYLYIAAGDIAELGSWIVESHPGAFRATNLRGVVNRNIQNTKPAVVPIYIRKSGEYRIWARTRDFATDQGARFFALSIAGQRLRHMFGRHGYDGWRWEDGGTIYLEAGSTVLEIIDTSGYYARVDGVLITDDLDFHPPSTYEALRDLRGLRTIHSTIRENLDAALAFPTHAISDALPRREVTLQNDRMRITFYEVETANGPVIQQAIAVRNGTEWVVAKSRTTEFGFLLIYANESKVSSYIDYQFPQWQQHLADSGSTIMSADIFRAGLPYWLIPMTMEKLSSDSVRLVAESPVARLETLWTLADDFEEPIVTWRLIAKQKGAFSVGAFNGPEVPLDDIDFLLLPHRFHSRRLPEESYLVLEAYAPTPVSLMSMSEPTDGHAYLTFGVVVDPSEIPYRWAHRETSRFGLGILGRHGGVQPYVFAPVLGSSEASLEVGDVHEFTYRPVIRLDSWFETYRHVVTGIYRFRDYRSNYYASLTDTMFNIQTLMMDDFYGGWDPIGLAHYNMEGRNTVSLASPLTPIQSYLLTEDPEIYERRTVPTLQYLVSRGGLHFKAGGPSGGFLVIGDRSPVGSPVSGYGTAVYGGAYRMTQGRTPVLRHIGLDSGVRHSPAYASVSRWYEELSYYLYTGDKSALERAMNGADQYIDTVVYGPDYTVPEAREFVYLAYAPDWVSLLDLYEVTGKQEYLDAAVYAARWFLTLLWTQPVIPEEQITIRSNDLLRRGFMDGTTGYWWRGNERFRLGHPDSYSRLKDETVPAWLPARAGLGMEQTTSFTSTDHANIIMSNWAPDLLRLAVHSGDDLFEVYARNAVIGRYANYPGYYQNQFMVHQMKEDYPYVGPDLTNIYYHHIPALLSLTVDYLLAQAWKLSDRQVEFPFVRQLGYAWFNNRHYGHAPGRLFEHEDMWLWLKPGLVAVDDIHIDWIAARSNGRFGLVLMNASNRGDRIVEVQLGEEVTGNVAFNTTARLEYPGGKVEEVAVKDGRLQVEVPKRGLVVVMIDAPAVTAPAYATTAQDDAQSDHEPISRPSGLRDFGTGVIIQVDPRFYHAYIYLDWGPELIQNATLHWRVGDGNWQQTQRDVYPFEFSIRVDEPDQPLFFYIEAVNIRGDLLRSTERVLKP